MSYHSNRLSEWVRSGWIRIEPASLSADGFNLPRKIYHILGLIIPLALYFDTFAEFAPDRSSLSREVCLALLGALIILLVTIDTLRFGSASLNRLFVQTLGPLLKSEESKRYNATIPYFLACFALMLFFSDVVVVLACIYLMVGDPLAAYVGGYLGRVRFWNGKSLEGLLAFIVAGYLGCLVFLLAHQIGSGPEATFLIWNGDGQAQFGTLLATLAGVVCAALAEFFSVIRWRGIFDDNLVVPLSGALGLALFALVWPGTPDRAAIFYDTTRLFAPL